MLQIMELVISQSLIKFIEQLVDEDGSVKDSAVGQSLHLPLPFWFHLVHPLVDCRFFLFQSSNLRHSRERVRLLERKVKSYILSCDNT